MVSELLQENGEIAYEVNPNNRIQLNLSNLQANILKSHGRDQTYHIFLRFTTKNENLIKTRIRDHILPYLTSAARQYEDAAKRKSNPNYSGGLLGCFFLSADGYRALGYGKQLERFREASFLKGMKSRESYHFQRGDRQFTVENKDPHPKDWQARYQAEIHGMLLLAQNSHEINPSLEETARQIIANLEDIAEIFIERGRRLLTQEGEDIEHFGYRDGISNPFFGGGLGPEQTDRSDPLELVLAEDPLANEANSYGSYFVFRKLKQDVEGFKQQVETLSRQVNQGNRALTGAQIIGRFRDGTPVTKFNSAQGSAADTNNFDYADDNGSKCPVHAHIRRVNPRNGREQDHRLIRRGIPYGSPGETEVGLLFMCYQRSLHAQFEFVQRVWVDNPNFPLEKAGDDPLIGQDKAQQQWPKEYGNLEIGKQAFNFGGHVTLQGGEYFFAPSLSFLRNIKEKTMTDRSFLIIGTYNHEKYKKLSQISSDKNPNDFILVRKGIIRPENLTLRHEAQDVAVRMFGAVTTGRDISPEQPLDELFTFLDAFEHFQIPDEDVFIPIGNPKVREKLFANGRYGWVALAPESKIGLVREKIGWPDHPFCSVFDIQIIPLQGDFEKYAGVDPDEAWRQRGLDLYEHQTPASWKK